MRVPVPVNGSIPLLIAKTRKGFSIQNVSSVDVYYSDDQRLLDSVDAANLPTVGHILPASTPPLPPTIYPFFFGKIYCRAQNTGAAVEILVYEVDPVPCALAAAA